MADMVCARHGLPDAAPVAMDRDALAHARALLDAALHENPVPPQPARQALRALHREQRRLRHAGRAHAHLNAARMACAQLAGGLAPGRLKLSACLQILRAHLAQDGGAGSAAGGGQVDL